jgi:hypothetical protein
MGKQIHRANGVEAPEVKQALAKAEEYAKLGSELINYFDLTIRS